MSLTDEVPGQQERLGSGAISSVDVPYWEKKKKKQKGWVSLLRLQCKSYSCNKTCIPVYYSLVGKDSKEIKPYKDITESYGYMYLHKV